MRFRTTSRRTCSNQHVEQFEVVYTYMRLAAWIGVMPAMCRLFSLRYKSPTFQTWFLYWIRLKSYIIYTSRITKVTFIYYKRKISLLFRSMLFTGYLLLVTSTHLHISRSSYFPWQLLYFFPLPHGQGSLRPTLRSWRTTSCISCGGTCGIPPPRHRIGFCFCCYCASAATSSRCLCFFGCGACCDRGHVLFWLFCMRISTFPVKYRAIPQGTTGFAQVLTTLTNILLHCFSTDLTHC